MDPQIEDAGPSDGCTCHKYEIIVYFPHPDERELIERSALRLICRYATVSQCNSIVGSLTAIRGSAGRGERDGFES